MTSTLFDRIGGPAIAATVDRFFEKVLHDEVTREVFASLEQGATREVAFMAWAFGGQASLSDLHFNAATRHLRDALNELAVEPSLIDEALAVVAERRPQTLPGLPFDHVVVRLPAGSELMSAQQFLELALLDRVQLILAGDLEFFVNGQRLDFATALEGLRGARRQAQ